MLIVPRPENANQYAQQVASIESKSSFRRLRNLACRPVADIWLVIKVTVMLGLFRLAIDVLSFDRLEKYLGSRLTETATVIPLDHVLFARKVRWAIAAVGPHTPWNSNCFPQALCGRFLLGRAGITSTLYMGAAFTPEGGTLQAHAWLRCGHLYITGGDSGDEFGAVASFGA